MSALPAELRLSRILAIVPWIAAAEGPHISEVCARFGMNEAELLADLDLLLFCGVYPFTPDTLIEVDVIDDRVWLRFADYFRRPLRLTPPEGLALLSAGGALLAIPGADTPGTALAGALGKLEEALGVSRDEALDVTLGPVTPEVLDAVRRATDAGRKLEIDYYSFGRDGRSLRTVQPWKVFNRAGQWYLSGWCEQAAAERLFRIDRIRAAEVLDELSPPRPDPIDEARSMANPARKPKAESAAGATPGVYQPEASDPLVVLDLAPPAHWVAEQYPHEGVEHLDGGRLRIRLRYNQRRWLERLLLRVGSDVTLVEGDPTVRADAAARILARYGA
jgi:proteasome accessory factor C